MSTFVNLLDIVYPTGSIYCSTSSTSPATSFGGTWSQIKGAVLGATGANSFASAGNNGGSLKINKLQLPQHAHEIGNGLNSNLDYDTSWGTEARTTSHGSSTARPESTSINMVNWSGGGAARIIDGDIMYCGKESNTNWIVPLYAKHLVSGGGQDYLPYHYGCYVWRRTA